MLQVITSYQNKLYMFINDTIIVINVKYSNASVNVLYT